jgi:hypothetical protein
VRGPSGWRHQRRLLLLQYGVFRFVTAIGFTSTRRANNQAGLFRSWPLMLRARQYGITTSHLRLLVQRFNYFQLLQKHKINLRYMRNFLTALNTLLFRTRSESETSKRILQTTRLAVSICFFYKTTVLWKSSWNGKLLASSVEVGLSAGAARWVLRQSGAVNCRFGRGESARRSRHVQDSRRSTVSCTSAPGMF